MMSRSYWPRTRPDIQPSSAPSSAPAMPRANGAIGPFDMRSPSFSVTGRSSRRNEATFARTQPARSVTRARAGPARLCSPVVSATATSAWAVNSSKSGASEA